MSAVTFSPHIFQAQQALTSVSCCLLDSIVKDKGAESTTFSFPDSEIGPKVVTFQIRSAPFPWPVFKSKIQHAKKS